MNHPEHGKITERTLDTRVHDNEKKLFCERCHTYVDSLEEFDEVDCDHHKNVHERITGELDETTETGGETVE